DDVERNWSPKTRHRSADTVLFPSISLSALWRCNRETRLDQSLSCHYQRWPALHRPGLTRPHRDLAETRTNFASARGNARRSEHHRRWTDVDRICVRTNPAVAGEHEAIIHESQCKSRSPD